MNKSAAIGSNWKKFMAIGCSHGHLANRKALETVLRFAEIWKPETRIHLGDFTDQAAFRGGAKGTSDETASIKDDLTAGLTFLREFRPTLVLNGNHEDRLWRLAHHHNEIVARAASTVITEICDLVRSLNAKHVDGYAITQRNPMIGDTSLLHGYMYSENAIRDHAEHFGKCIIAHLHIVGSAAGRRLDGPKAYCVGTLADIPAMEYAKTRRATARWQHGFAWGEYNKHECIVYLAEANRGREWRLPL